MSYAPDQLLPALRDYLISQGLVRKPSVAGSAHPCWLDPKRGVPYPGQTENINPVESDPSLVVGIYPATGIPSQPYEGFLVILGAQIWYRGKFSPPVQTFHEQVRGVLEDRHNFNMSSLLINWSRMSREVQRIGSDERGYVYTSEWLFDMYNPSYVFN